MADSKLFALKILSKTSTKQISSTNNISWGTALYAIHLMKNINELTAYTSSMQTRLVLHGIKAQSKQNTRMLLCLIRKSRQLYFLLLYQLFTLMPRNPPPSTKHRSVDMFTYLCLWRSSWRACNASQRLVPGLASGSVRHCAVYHRCYCSPVAEADPPPNWHRRRHQCDPWLFITIQTIVQATMETTARCGSLTHSRN